MTEQERYKENEDDRWNGDGQFIVWADGPMCGARTRIKVFHVSDRAIKHRGLGGCLSSFLSIRPSSSKTRKKLLYRSDSQDRCEQVAEEMREAQREHRLFEKKLVEEFSNSIQYIADSAMEEDEHSPEEMAKAQAEREATIKRLEALLHKNLS